MVEDYGARDVQDDNTVIHLPLRYPSKQFGIMELVQNLLPIVNILLEVKTP